MVEKVGPRLKTWVLVVELLSEFFILQGVEVDRQFLGVLTEEVFVETFLHLFIPSLEQYLSEWGLYAFGGRGDVYQLVFKDFFDV